MPDTAAATVTRIRSTPPKAPAGLRAGGRRLWKTFTTKYGFDIRELVLLEAACRQQDHIDDLDKVLRTEGVTTTGSKGQTRMHPAVAEARLARQALRTLLSSIPLPEDPTLTPPGAPRTRTGTSAARSERGRKAANSRWSKQDAANAEAEREATRTD